MSDMWDIIIIAVLALCAAAGVIKIVKDKKRGGCDGNCAACGSIKKNNHR